MNMNEVGKYYGNLIVGRLIGGRWYVRPDSWAGVWNARGELVGCNTLFTADTEQECLDFVIKNRLAKLNEIEVYEYSCAGEEVEYVITENSEQNRRILHELRVQEEFIDEVTEDNMIDISRIAFECLGAEWWWNKHGFGIGDPPEVDSYL